MKTNILLSHNLNRLLDLRDVSQSELARYTGVTPAAVNGWCKGAMPAPDKIDLICRFFQTTPADLLLDPEKLADRRAEYKAIPLYSALSAGVGFWAESNIERYVAVDRSVTGDFAVIVRGNSMINAGIRDGDVAIMSKHFRFEEGRIYAVWQVGEELAYIKRVYINGNKYLLVSENPDYAPFSLENNEVVIVGELSGIYRKIDQP